MAYSLEVAADINRALEKLAKKDKVAFQAIHKKVPGI